jgi:hypothetical protein
MSTEHTDRRRADLDTNRVRLRDSALRRTKVLVAGIAAGAVALSGLFSVVAAQAFKGHQQAGSTAATTDDGGAQAVPPTSHDPAPLRPPAQPPAASDRQPSGSAPQPQVSGGS